MEQLSSKNKIHFSHKKGSFQFPNIKINLFKNPLHLTLGIEIETISEEQYFIC